MQVQQPLTDEQALGVIVQILDQVPLTGPQHRQMGACLQHIKFRLGIGVPPPPAKEDETEEETPCELC